MISLISKDSWLFLYSLFQWTAWGVFGDAYITQIVMEYEGLILKKSMQ